MHSPQDSSLGNIQNPVNRRQSFILIAYGEEAVVDPGQALLPVLGGEAGGAAGV